MAWRDLKGDGTPAHWLGDDVLESVTPRMVSVREIKRAVALANAAPEMLALIESLLPLLWERCDKSPECSAIYQDAANIIKRFK